MAYVRCELCRSNNIGRSGICRDCGWSPEPEPDDDGEDGMTYENRDFDHEAAILRDFF